MEGEEGGKFITYLILCQMCLPLFFSLLIVYLQIVKTSPFSARKSNTNNVTDTFINLANIHKVHSFGSLFCTHWQRFYPTIAFYSTNIGLFTRLPFDPLSLLCITNM